MKCLGFALLIAVTGFKNIAGENSCTSNKNCIDCISTKDCVWCLNYAFEGKDFTALRIPRCDTLANHKNRKDGFCGTEKFLEIPSSYMIITANHKVDQLRKIHISPQKAKVKLAVGKPVSIELTYLEDTDKRLDLYYLLDLSATMKPNKESVASESHRLADELKNLTKDVRLGFGSFVDKPVQPFASYVQLNTQRDHVPPYGFKHQLPLTDIITDFQKAVHRSQISANTDIAEGGLDAIMQVLKCRREIGWREDSTKVLVIATDGPFHIAGDGKIGGIVEPNDMECHLNKDGDYTHSTILDYPSIGQINHVVKNTQTRLIFAVTENRYDLYGQLSKRIAESTVGKLRIGKNSDNVVELVRNQYNSIKGNVKLTSDASPQFLDYVDIKFESKCKRNAPWNESDTCAHVGPGNEVQFKVTFLLRQCPPDLREGEINFTTFELTGRENLGVNWKLDCDCNCSSNPITDTQELLSICKGNAKHLQCGTCVCDDQHTGKNCECDIKNTSYTGSTTECRQKDSMMECSGRGVCLCGECHCDSGWGGPFCECNNRDCKVDPNNIHQRQCWGHGRCPCSKCECNPGRDGDKCQCLAEKKGCIEPGSTSECNGRGQCTCSVPNTEDFGDWEWECSCNQGTNPEYSGQYCHICQNCQSESKTDSRCSDPNLRACVGCHMNNADTSICSKFCSLEKKSSHEISEYRVELVSSFNEHKTSESITCDIPFNQTCSVSTLIEYLSGQEALTLKVVIANSRTTCPPPIDFLPIIGYGAGGVIFIGLLTLLLWKLFTFVLDSREFRRFEKDRADAKWAKGENPLYSAPLSTFQNPAYRN